MTINTLTKEEKEERRKKYQKAYAKAYYHLIKDEEPEKYKKRLEADNKRAQLRYKKMKEQENKTVSEKIQKPRRIKININEL